MRRALLILLSCGVAGLVIGFYVFLRTERTDAEAERLLRERVHTLHNPPPKPGEFLGSLLIPRLNTQTPIVEGAGKRELDKAPGHLQGSPLPGQPGNVVIAGHRDTQFRSLQHLRRGDVILVESAGDIHLYRIVNQTTVFPTDTRVIDPTPRPTLTLITCYPFYFVGHAPKRYILQAELIS